MHALPSMHPTSIEVKLLQCRTLIDSTFYREAILDRCSLACFITLPSRYYHSTTHVVHKQLVQFEVVETLCTLQVYCPCSFQCLLIIPSLLQILYLSVAHALTSPDVSTPILLACTHLPSLSLFNNTVKPVKYAF